MRGEIGSYTNITESTDNSPKWMKTTEGKWERINDYFSSSTGSSMLNIYLENKHEIDKLKLESMNLNHSIELTENLLLSKYITQSLENKDIENREGMNQESQDSQYWSGNENNNRNET